MKRIVFFDIDRTLTRGVSSGAYLANLLGHGKLMEEMEGAYARGEIDNDEVCSIDAAGYAGHSTEELFGMLENMPLVDGVACAVEAVHAAGGEAHIASLAWDVVAAYLCERYGFDGYVAARGNIGSLQCDRGGRARCYARLSWVEYRGSTRSGAVNGSIGDGFIRFTAVAN